MKKKLNTLIESIHNIIDKEFYDLSESEKSDLFNEFIYNALSEAINTSIIPNTKHRSTLEKKLQPDDKKQQVMAAKYDMRLGNPNVLPKARERILKFCSIILKKYPDVADSPEELANAILNSPNSPTSYLGA